MNLATFASVGGFFYRFYETETEELVFWYGNMEDF